MCVPESMTVQKLKALLQRLYKVDPINMTLTYSSLKVPSHQMDYTIYCVHDHFRSRDILFLSCLSGHPYNRLNVLSTVIPECMKGISL